MEFFNIVQAICRSALSNPSSALIHQIERLKEALEKGGHKTEAKSIGTLLSHSGKNFELAPSRIHRSWKVFSGEEMSIKTQIPVDKESSTPLAEVLFPESLPDSPPLFSESVSMGIGSIVNEWKNFEKLIEIDAQPAQSCLIFGESGTGKTHLAYWIGRQLQLPIVVVRLDGLMSSFLGTTSRNIGGLFDFANRYKCILLLDEFDAIAKLRNDPQEVGEIKRVVNTLLQNLDKRRFSGFTIGITNHEDLLDPAIWRRFDVQVHIPKPSMSVMTQLIDQFMKPIELDEGETKFLSWSLENASGADVEALVRWLKKSLLLEKDKLNIVEHVRRFAVLNNGRISPLRRNLLVKQDDDIAQALANDETYLFKQKEIAALVGKNPSTLSKILAKK